VESRVTTANVFANGNTVVIRIGKKGLPPSVSQLADGYRVLFNVEQPNDGDNLTIFRLLFQARGRKYPESVRSIRFHNSKLIFKRQGTPAVRVKTRYIRACQHPVPHGSYSAVWLWDDEASLLTMQACTLKRTPDPSTPKTKIIVPGDVEFYEPPTITPRIIH